MLNAHCGMRSVASRRIAVALVWWVLPMSLGAQGDRAARSGDTTVIPLRAPSTMSTLVPEARSSDSIGLSNVTSLAIAADGTVLVVDRSGFTARVLHLDASGALLREIGRMGSGPGEFRGPGTVVVLGDGRVLVSDVGRIQVFSSAGQWIEQWSSPTVATNMGSALYADVAGGVAELASTILPNSFTERLMLLRMKGDGSIADSAAVPFADVDRLGRIGRVQVPLYPRRVSAWSPLGYFVTCLTDSYRIDLRKPQGFDAGMASRWEASHGVVSLRMAVAATPIQAAEALDWRRSVEMFMRVREPAWIWNGPPIPHTKPIVNDLSVDADGRIWVRLHQRARLVDSVRIPEAPVASGPYGVDARKRWIEPTLLHVLQPYGAVVGQIALPDGVELFAASGNILWVVTRTAYDVPVVVRYRIRW